MASAKRIVVCATQVPFLDGGAEAHTRGLVEQLRRRGHRAEQVTLPFKWYPPREILAHAAAWRLIDLSESGGEPIDLVIASRFPSYFVRHPRKVTWLIHQYRPAYDLCGTDFSEFTHDDRDVGLRETLMRLDRRDAPGVPAGLRHLAQRRGAARTIQRPDRDDALPSRRRSPTASRPVRAGTTCCRSGSS